MTAYRVVVASQQFEADREKIEKDVQRWDEVFRGVEWALSRVPEYGQPTSVDGVLGLPTDDWPGVPSCVVYYRYDDRQVILLGIRPPPPWAQKTLAFVPHRLARREWKVGSIRGRSGCGPHS